MRNATSSDRQGRISSLRRGMSFTSCDQSLLSIPVVIVAYTGPSIIFASTEARVMASSDPRMPDNRASMHSILPLRELCSVFTTLIFAQSSKSLYFHTRNRQRQTAKDETRIIRIEFTLAKNPTKRLPVKPEGLSPEIKSKCVRA